MMLPAVAWLADLASRERVWHLQKEYTERCAEAPLVFLFAALLFL